LTSPFPTHAFLKECGSAQKGRPRSSFRSIAEPLLLILDNAFLVLYDVQAFGYSIRKYFQKARRREVKLDSFFIEKKERRTIR